MTFIITIVLCTLITIMFALADRASAKRKRSDWPMKIIVTLGFVILVIGFGLFAGWILTFAIKDTLQVFFGIMVFILTLAMWCATVVGKREEEAWEKYINAHKYLKEYEDGIHGNTDRKNIL